MKLYDARVCLGRDVDLPPFQHSDLDSVKRMLDKYGVERAFFVSYASFRLSFEAGNEMTFEAAAQDDRLIPCPTVVPNSGGETGEEAAFVRGLVERGARCVGFYPETCGIALDRRVLGDLFDAVSRLCLPVMIPAEEAEVPQAADLAVQFPDVPFIVSSPSPRNRNLYPMFRAAPNLHLAISPSFATNEGLEDMVQRFGSDRLLYASNFPESEPGAAIGFLMYSQIADEDLHAIAYGNMQRLTDGVRDV